MNEFKDVYKQYYTVYLYLFFKRKIIIQNQIIVWLDFNFVWHAFAQENECM